MTKIFSIVPLSLAAILCVQFSEAVRADPVACGDLITTDTILETDLNCSDGDGLQIAADGVTVDLGGYTISSSSVLGSGIWIDGFDNITIKDGAIKGFQDGVRADFGVANLRIKELSISGQTLSGIVVIRSSDVRISNVRISQRWSDAAILPEAIRLANVDAAEVNHVTVDGGAFGVLSIGGQLDQPGQVSSGLKVSNSTFANVDIGILVNRNDGVLIRKNRIIGTDHGEGCFAGIGILSEPSSRVYMFENVITGCTDGILTDTHPQSSDFIIWMNEVYSNVNGMILFRLTDSRIGHNMVHMNKDAGIGLGHESINNLILNNRVTGNGLADMSHDESSAPNSWSGNICVTSDEGAEVDCAD